ncbi:MAG: hypothetical protein M1838_006171 [Thelocarpon superellum]|nr:MAG: hypothetical protein M1838_006171 [Thelocarpon superellum]
MARLNEPPAPTESLDALKRRFIRQNREIARANSAQSLRIRSLESETSRLLAENTTLREQIIRLETELSKNCSRNVFDDVDGIRGQLEDKLDELGQIVAGLAKVREKSRSQPSAKVTYSDPRPSANRSPDEKNWKNNFTLAEVTSNLDGRLPPILEDKCYPRISIDGHDFLHLASDPENPADSPDLGPPPVAHFEEEEAAILDVRLPSHQANDLPDDIDRRNLSSNLETRKKRRESANLFTYRRPTGAEISSVEADHRSRTDAADDDHKQAFRAGAKRKLDVREEADQEPTIEPRTDPTTISRKTTSARDGTPAVKPLKAGQTTNRARDLQSTTGSRGLRRDPDISVALERKALGPKDVNTDPISSPPKPVRTSSLEAASAAKKDSAKKDAGRDRARERTTPCTKTKSTGKPRAREVEPISLAFVEPTPPPKTPAAFDVMCPSSEPSAVRHDSRDTPPPPDLDPDGTAMGRAGRRPRGKVNYAEPNLRDKMRRPTKVLVDAVTGEGKARRDSSFKAESGRAEGDDGGVASQSKPIRTVVIKKESEGETPWKRLPSSTSTQTSHAGDRSPLMEKTATEAPSEAEDMAARHASQQRRRRGSTLHDDDRQGERDTDASKSASASAISALVAGGKKASREGERGKERERKDEVDIYEFDGTSPPRPASDIGQRHNSGSSVGTTSRQSSSGGGSSSGISKSRRQTLTKSTALAPVSTEARQSTSGHETENDAATSLRDHHHGMGGQEQGRGKAATNVLRPVDEACSFDEV